MVGNETVEMSEDRKTKTFSGRKRLNEIELQQDEPPAKKGTSSVANRRAVGKQTPILVNRKVANRKKFTCLRNKVWENLNVPNFYTNVNYLENGCI